MRFKNLKSALVIAAVIGLAASAYAQGPPPPPPPGGPGGTGPGMHPPGQPPTADEVFKEIDANGDGMITPDEFAVWFKPPMGPGQGGPGQGGPGMGPGQGGPGMGGPGMGPRQGGPGQGGPGMGPGQGGPGMGGPGMGGPGQGGPGMGPGQGGPGQGGPGMGPGQGVPPECSDQLRQSEQLPQAENVMASNGQQGNLIFRTVCGSNPEFAIVLPGGRMALDFGVEAITQNNVFFGIRVEGGPNVWDVSMGKAAFKGLVLTDVAPSPTGKYTIYLDPAQSDPGARVTVRFIDTPK